MDAWHFDTMTSSDINAPLCDGCGTTVTSSNQRYRDIRFEDSLLFVTLIILFSAVIST